MRDISEIRLQLKERGRVCLADENRDSVLFLGILDELCHHIELLESAALPKPEVRSQPELLGRGPVQPRASERNS